MVYEYFEATHDYDFIKKALPILEKVKRYSKIILKNKNESLGNGILDKRTRY